MMNEAASRSLAVTNARRYEAPGGTWDGKVIGAARPLGAPIRVRANAVSATV